MIAAITSCTNTSNPQVMVGARAARAGRRSSAGLERQPWVKSSLAPGLARRHATTTSSAGPAAATSTSSASTRSATAARPASATRARCRRDLGRDHRGRPRRLRGALRQPQLRGAHPPRGEGELPRLAAARRRLRARRPDGHRLRDEPIGTGRRATTSTCATSGRAPPRSARRSRRRCAREQFAETYADVFTGDEAWRSLPVPEGELFAWEPDSTYVRQPPYFEGMTREPARGRRHRRRARASSGSATRSRPTTSRRPARSGPTRRRASTCVEHGVERKDFNSYGARRGNHEVMVRGTFANVRLRNLLVPGSEGTWTVHVPSGEEMTIFDASQRYLAEGTPHDRARRQGVRLGLVARLGGQGPEPARREGGDRRVATSASTARTC